MPGTPRVLSRLFQSRVIPAWGTLAACLLSPADAAQAQVGLTSRTASVALVAHVPARAVVREVGTPVARARSGNLVEASVKVQMEANTACRLVVRGFDGAGAQIWVRGTDGEFRSLAPGAAITVAQERNPAGEWSSEVVYRIERDEVAADDIPLPVRYEVAVVPRL